MSYTPHQRVCETSSSHCQTLPTHNDHVQYRKAQHTLSYNTGTSQMLHNRLSLFPTHIHQMWPLNKKCECLPKHVNNQCTEEAWSIQPLGHRKYVRILVDRSHCDPLSRFLTGSVTNIWISSEATLHSYEIWTIMYVFEALTNKTIYRTQHHSCHDFVVIAYWLEAVNTVCLYAEKTALAPGERRQTKGDR